MNPCAEDGGDTIRPMKRMKTEHYESAVDDDGAILLKEEPHSFVEENQSAKEHDSHVIFAPLSDQSHVFDGQEVFSAAVEQGGNFVERDDGSAVSDAQMNKDEESINILPGTDQVKKVDSNLQANKTSVQEKDNNGNVINAPSQFKEKEVIDLTGDSDNEHDAEQEVPITAPDDRKRKRADHNHSSKSKRRSKRTSYRPVLTTSSLLAFPGPFEDATPTPIALAHHIERAAGQNHAPYKQPLGPGHSESTLHDDLETILRNVLEHYQVGGGTSSGSASRVGYAGNVSDANPDLDSEPEDIWELHLLDRSKYDVFGLCFLLACGNVKNDWVRRYGERGVRAFDEGCVLLKQYLVWREIRTKWAHSERLQGDEENAEAVGDGEY